MPKYGCINIHASLLPKYRGCAPIQWAILNGEKKAGVTIMQMDEGLDTGDMLLTAETDISDDDTADSLHDKLAVLGADLIVEALNKLSAGELKAVPQPEGPLFYASMIKKEDGKINFSEGAEKISLQIRGMYSWPGSFAYFNGALVKISSARPVNENDNAKCGEVTRVTKNSFFVQTGDGLLEVLRMQPQGKKDMSVHDYLLGKKINIGDAFTDHE